jgi:hypothetical protein
MVHYLFKLIMELCHTEEGQLDVQSWLLMDQVEKEMLWL